MIHADIHNTINKGHKKGGRTEEFSFSYFRAPVLPITFNSPAVLSPWCWSPATTHLSTYSFHPELQQLRCTHLPVILLTSHLWIIGNKDHQSHSSCHSQTCSITLHGALRFLVFTKSSLPRLIHFLPTIFYLEYISLVSSCLQAWDSCFSFMFHFMPVNKYLFY